MHSRVNKRKYDLLKHTCSYLISSLRKKLLTFSGNFEAFFATKTFTGCFGGFSEAVTPELDPITSPVEVALVEGFFFKSSFSLRFKTVSAISTSRFFILELDCLLQEDHKIAKSYEYVTI